MLDTDKPSLLIVPVGILILIHPVKTDNIAHVSSSYKINFPINKIQMMVTLKNQEHQILDPQFRLSIE